MSIITALICAQLQTVTFHRPVEPLHALLPELAKVTGHKLAVSPDMKWQLLYVRVKDVSPRDLYNRIAKATYGRWVRNVGDVNVLEFDKGRLARELAEKTKKRRVQIAKAIAEEIKAQKVPSSDEPTGYELPPELVHMFAAIGADRLAHIGPEGRVVFSTRPNRSQQPFPNFKPEWLESIRVRENVSRARVANRATVPVSPEVEKARKLLDPAYWESRKRQTGIFSAQLFTEPFAKFDLMIECDDYAVSGEFIGSDQSGLIQVLDGGNLDIREDQVDAPEDESKEDSTPVKLSPKARRVFDYWRYKEVPELKQDVLTFRKSDPFLNVYRECLDAYAKSRNENLVLGLIDQQVPGNASNILVATVEQWLSENRTWELSEGWRVNIPQKPPVPYDRDRVAELVDRFGHKKVVDLDDLAWLATTFEAHFDPEFELPGWILEILGHEFPDDVDLLRVYGHLSASERKRLKDGETLFASLMPAKARAILEILCSGRNRAVGPLQPIREPEASDYILQMQRGMEWVFTTSDEPTNVFPDGLPASATFSLDLKTFPAYTADWLSNPRGHQQHDLISEYVEVLMDPEKAAEPREVTVTKHDRALFTFLGTPKVGLREAHTILRSGPGDKKLKMGELDADFHKTLAIKLARAKQYKAYRDALGTSSGTKDPPPP